MRKHNYVVGHKDEGEYVCGRKNESWCNEVAYPMTLIQAKKRLEEYPQSNNDELVVYKLVEVENVKINRKS